MSAKNQIIENAVVVSNVVVSETAILKAVTKKVNTYQANVLDVNKNFKVALRSTGQAIKILLSSETLIPKQIKFLKALTVKGSEAKYATFDKSIRRTKDNKITVFYLLQALNRAL